MLSTMNSPGGFLSPQKPEPKLAPRTRFRNRRDELDARPKLNAWKRIPAYRRALLIFLVLGVAVATFRDELLEFYHDLQPKIAKVLVVDFDGNPIPMDGRADIFELDRSLFMPSPMPRLGSVKLDNAIEALVLDDSIYPNSLQVRFHVPGYGIDYTSVDLGKRRTFRLRLGRPIEINGRVIVRSRSPVSGARVVALGGSTRGVVLEETATLADGSFTLAGISEHVDFLVLRILKEGYALEEREYWRNSSTQRRTDFQLVPVPPVHGVVKVPSNLLTDTLRMSVLNLAGVTAAVGKDGKFVLHNLSAGGQYRLLVQGLPKGFTHRETYVQPGHHIEVEVVPSVVLRGEVFSERLDRALENVELWHTNSTRGNERCVTDGYGRFELRNVPTGEVVLRVVSPKDHFGGSSTEQRVVVKPENAEEPVSIRIR